MTLALGDLTRDTTQTTGTGTLTLDNATPTVGQNFATRIPTGSTVWYEIRKDSAGQFETGLGTYTLSGSTLSRDAVFESSNGSVAQGYSKVDFSAGATVVIALPASRAAGILSVVNPINSIPWVRWFKADAITPQSDASALASWVDSSENADPATQSSATLKPLYKIAANGINGVPVVRFDGSNDYLRTTSGGTSMTGNFYMAALVKFNDVTGLQHILCLGDDVTDGHRRGMLKWGTDAIHDNIITFNGQNADVRATDAQFALTTATVYFLEIYYDGTYIYIFKNGRRVIKGTPTPNPLASFSNAPITLAANNTPGEYAALDMAEAMFLASVPTNAQRATIYQYIQAKYALTLNRTSSTYYWIGLGPLFVGSTIDGTDDELASLTINGTVAIDSQAGGIALKITNNAGEFNSFAVRNVSTTGFSAGVYQHQVSGAEMGAIGFAYAGASPWGDTDGSMYVEFSNFNDGSKYGSFRGVQTKGSGPLSRLRWDWRPDGGYAAYAQDGSTALWGFDSAGTVTTQPATAPIAGGGLAAALLCTSTAKLGVYFGTGTPTFLAAKGSLYIKTDATTSATRLFIATDAVGTWAAFTAAS